MPRKPDPSIRSRILEEAEHLIHLKGFNSTSLEEIARRCGMSKANVLHHFASKEELGLAVLDAKIADYRQKRVDGCCRMRDPEAALDRLFGDAAGFQRRNGCRAGCLVGNIALEMSDRSEAFRKRTSEFFSHWEREFARSLRDNGGRSSDARSISEAVIALYEGAVMLARSRRDAGVLLRVGRVARGLLAGTKTAAADQVNGFHGGFKQPKTKKRRS